MNAHRALAAFLKELELAILRSENVSDRTFARAEWSAWVRFSFGLAGAIALEGPEYCSDPDYYAAVYAGDSARRELSTEAQQAIRDIDVALPVEPGDPQPDDWYWVSQYWGSITETAFENGIAVPPEVEAAVDRERTVTERKAQ